METSNAAASSNTLIRILGLSITTVAFMAMTASVANGEEPSEKPQYAEWVVSYNDANMRTWTSGTKNVTNEAMKLLMRAVISTDRKE